MQLYEEEKGNVIELEEHKAGYPIPVPMPTPATNLAEAPAQASSQPPAPVPVPGMVDPQQPQMSVPTQAPMGGVHTEPEVVKQIDPNMIPAPTPAIPVQYPESVEVKMGNMQINQNQ
jgi:hypothetical protein